MSSKSVGIHDLDRARNAATATECLVPDPTLKNVPQIELLRGFPRAWGKLAMTARRTLLSRAARNVRHPEPENPEIAPRSSPSPTESAPAPADVNQLPS